MKRRPSSHEKDHRTFADEGVTYGAIGDSHNADLVIYLAGNQFMVMEPLVAAFRRMHPDIGKVYVMTIPPGEALEKHILDQGEVGGEPTSRFPDLYGSVGFKHLRRLVGVGRMSDCIVYARNRLALMVAEGNPKGVTGARDLGRDDLVQCQPNPTTEGIMRFFGKPMLEELGLWNSVSGAKTVTGGWAVEGRVWFTERHHRDTPEMIENGEADVGIVWATEIAEAEREGRAVEGVAIGAPLDRSDEVFYAMGPLADGRNSFNAVRYMSFLGTDEAQDILAAHRFARAEPSDLKLIPIP